MTILIVAEIEVSPVFDQEEEKQLSSTHIYDVGRRKENKMRSPELNRRRNGIEQIDLTRMRSLFWIR